MPSNQGGLFGDNRFADKKNNQYKCFSGYGKRILRIFAKTGTALGARQNLVLLPIVPGMSGRLFAVLFVEEQDVLGPGFPHGGDGLHRQQSKLVEPQKRIEQVEFQPLPAGKREKFMVGFAGGQDSLEMFLQFSSRPSVFGRQVASVLVRPKNKR